MYVHMLLFLVKGVSFLGLVIRKLGFFFGSRASIKEKKFHFGWDSGSLSVFFFFFINLHMLRKKKKWV